VALAVVVSSAVACLAWDEDAPFRIRVVRDADGTPVAGARVIAVDDVRVAAAISDPEGNAIGAWTARPRENDSCRVGCSVVHVWADGFARGECGALDGGIRLVADVPVSGRVIDAADGRALAGIRVIASDVNDTDWSAARDRYGDQGASFGEFGTAATNENGTFVLHGVPRDATAYLVLDPDPGYADPAVTFVRSDGARDDEQVRVVREPVGSIAGVVVSPDGEPAAEARVTLYPASDAAPLEPFCPFRGSDHRDETLTRSDGTFAFPAVPRAGRYVVWAEAAGSSRSANAKAVPGAGAPLELRLRRETIVDISAEYPGGELVQEALSFDECRAPGTPAARWGGGSDMTLRVPGPHVISVCGRAGVSGVVRLDVPEGLHGTQRVKLHAASDVAGVVVDAAGNPVPDVTVAADTFRLGADAALSSNCADTDDDGIFRIGGLCDGPIEVHVLAGISVVGTEGVSWAASERLRVTAPVATLRLVAPRRAPVRWTVKAPADAGQPTFHVESDDAGLVEWTDGANGSLWWLRPGRFHLTVTYPSGIAASRWFDWTPGEPLDLGTIAPGPLVACATRVVDESGRVLEDSGACPSGGRGTADVWRDLHRLDEQRSGSLWTERGVLRLGDEPPGDVEVLAVADGFVPRRATLSVRPGTPLPDVVLERGGLLVVTARAPDGGPAVDVDVEFADPRRPGVPERNFTTATNYLGRITTHMPPGRYRLTARHMGDVLGAATAVVREGGEARVVLRTRAR
jgi:hypothetical protein